MSSRPPLRPVDRNGERRPGGSASAGRDRRRRAQAHAHARGGRRDGCDGRTNKQQVDGAFRDKRDCRNQACSPGRLRPRPLPRRSLPVGSDLSRSSASATFGHQCPNPPNRRNLRANCSRTHRARIRKNPKSEQTALRQTPHSPLDRASHARGRWFETSRAHPPKPSSRSTNARPSSRAPRGRLRPARSRSITASAADAEAGIGRAVDEAESFLDHARCVPGGWR